MSVNTGKIQAIIIDKRKQDHTNEIFKIGTKEVKLASQVKVLGVEVHTLYLSIFSPNAGKYGPEKTPYLDTFHAVIRQSRWHWKRQKTVTILNI